LNDDTGFPWTKGTAMRRQPKSGTKFVICESNDSISTESRQIEDRIRQRAFELSQSRGHLGRDIDDWLAAESEVISVPPAELSEKDGMFVLQMAVGGIDFEELQIMTGPDEMLVKADLQHQHNPEGGTVHLCDFRSATVFRTIRFPEPIDSKSLKLQFREGMLRITAQKRSVAEGKVETKAKRATRVPRQRKKAS
jgi:HSP20 family molecular chaperone IbpA